MLFFKALYLKENQYSTTGYSDFLSNIIIVLVLLWIVKSANSS